MSEIECYQCHATIDAQTDEWWSHSWEEHPSEESVEEAIGDTDFRDWFRENKVLCSDCHSAVLEWWNDAA